MSTTASPPRKRPTQADVARLAGVSQAIVSYVLNNRYDEVSEETRLRVLGAIDELGYVPHGAARSLRTSRTMSIASIIPDITNPFYPALERGIQRSAEASGFDLIVSNTDGVAEKEARALLGLLRGHVDGAIMVPFSPHTDLIRNIVQTGIVLTLIARPIPDLIERGVDFIGVDTSEAGRLIIDYFVERGHRRVATITGIPGTPPGDQRLNGYRRAVARHGLDSDERLIQIGDFQEASGFTAMNALLDLEMPPTAVFAANDLMAIGAITAIRQRRLRVPDDIAVAGVDDIPAARFVDPPLTTITQFTEELGIGAAEFLISRIAGDAPATGRQHDHRVALVVRASA